MGDQKVAKLPIVYARVHFSTPRPVGESSHWMVWEALRRIVWPSEVTRSEKVWLEENTPDGGPSVWSEEWVEERRVKTRRERSPVAGMMKVPLRSFCCEGRLEQLVKVELIV